MGRGPERSHVGKRARGPYESPGVGKMAKGRELIQIVLNYLVYKVAVFI